jgi:replicative DNA helicase
MEADPIQITVRNDQLAENAVVSAFLLADGQGQKAFDTLTLLGLEPDHFWFEDYKELYQSIVNLCQKGKGVSVVTISSELKSRMVDTPDLLDTLAWAKTNAADSDTLTENATTVIDHARFRKLNDTLTESVSEVGIMSEYKDAVGMVQTKLSELIDVKEYGIRHMSDIHYEKKEGIGWGIPTLDNYTYGLVPGELTIVAGSTGDGKSMLAGEIARHVANNQHRVLIFTLEMTGEEWKMRNIHAQAHVRMRASKHDPAYTEEEELALTQAEALYDTLDLYVIDRANITPEQVISTVKLMPGDSGVSLVIIDYLQLLRMPQEGTEEQAISSTTRVFKQLAGELNTHVVLISQFNKQASYMVGEKTKCLYNDEFYNVPDHAHLKGSSAIAQDADRIILLQRHPFFDDDLGKHWWARCSGHIEVFITKQRSGNTGHGTLVRQFWEGRFRRFTKDELVSLRGSPAIPQSWLRDQGYE